MRVISACLLVVVAASLAAAQTTCTVPSSDPLSLTTASGCGLLARCQSNLCACVGSTSTTFPSCVAAISSSSSPCATTCFTAYVQCAVGITTRPINTTDTVCSNYNNTLYIAQLAAMASTTLNNTALQASCNYGVCALVAATNVSSLSTCGLALGQAACSASVLLPPTASPTTTVATTAAPVADIIVVVRLSGANWSAILADPVKKAQAITALTSDYAKLLGVDSKFVQIVSMVQGSLVVTFQVLQGSGKSPSQLQTLANSAAGSSTWLTSTASVYATVGTDSLTTLSVSVTATAAPTTLPPGSTTTAAPKSSAVGAAGVWAVAAVAALAALWA